MCALRPAAAARGAGSVVAPPPVPALSPAWLAVAIALLGATAAYSRAPVRA